MLAHALMKKRPMAGPSPVMPPAQRPMMPAPVPQRGGPMFPGRPSHYQPPGGSMFEEPSYGGIGGPMMPEDGAPEGIVGPQAATPQDEMLSSLLAALLMGRQRSPRFPGFNLTPHPGGGGPGGMLR